MRRFVLGTDRCVDRSCAFARWSRRGSGSTARSRCACTHPEFGGSVLDVVAVSATRPRGSPASLARPARRSVSTPHSALSRTPSRGRPSEDHKRALSRRRRRRVTRRRRGLEMVFSRFGTMFFASPVAALRNVKAALVPGGKLMAGARQLSTESFRDRGVRRADVRPKGPRDLLAVVQRIRTSARRVRVPANLEPFAKRSSALATGMTPAAA